MTGGRTGGFESSPILCSHRFDRLKPTSRIGRSCSSEPPGIGQASARSGTYAGPLRANAAFTSASSPTPPPPMRTSPALPSFRSRSRAPAEPPSSPSLAMQNASLASAAARSCVSAREASARTGRARSRRSRLAASSKRAWSIRTLAAASSARAAKLDAGYSASTPSSVAADCFDTPSRNIAPASGSYRRR